MSSDQDIVQDHRNLLRMSQKISEFQEQNLKSWGFVFFDNIKKYEVSYNFVKDKESKEFYAGEVSFDLTLEDLGEDVSQGVERLVASTKYLFWSDTNVIVKINGKEWQTN